MYSFCYKLYFTLFSMLLYAKTEEDIQSGNVYQMQENKIPVRTLDFNKLFSKITGQLNTIAKTYFDL